MGVFSYRQIKESLFRGFRVKRRGVFEIKEASKAKALFDYLYLKLFNVRRVDRNFTEALRLNLEEYSRKSQEEFSGYCRDSRIKKFANLAELVFL